tara:strand:+ start:862 stop:1068 length:207 start_codon:yes stop_codon:yes gene_type:complete
VRQIFAPPKREREREKEKARGTRRKGMAAESGNYEVPSRDACTGPTEEAMKRAFEKGREGQVFEMPQL